MERRYAVPLLAMLLAPSLLGLCGAEDQASIQIEGFVHGPDGAPLQNASIRLWGYYLEAEAFTDSEGHYELSATLEETSCQLYAFYDDPDTIGYDLLPSQKRLSTSDDSTMSINFTLQHAATVYVTGQFKPVESTTKIRKFALEVVDPVDGRTIQFGDYGLIYGTGMNVQSYFLGLDPMTLIVPADAPFAVKVSSSYQHERVQPSRYSRHRWRFTRQRTKIETFNEFVMVEGGGFKLGAGEVASLDIRRYSLTADMARVDPLVDETMANLTDVEERGFYVAAERHDLQEAKEILSGLDAKVENQEYEEAYVGLRQAYLKLLGVRSRLETVVLEASVSLNVLLAFVAMTAVALGAMFAESGSLRLLLTVCSYVPMILYLRLIYPGSSAVEPSSFALAGAASLLGVLLVTGVLPRVFGEALGERGLGGMGALVAVFSMGNRSLKRRRLRSLFTFTAILALTMSFVALTSLSTSYGLIFNRSGTDKPGAEGILVRNPEYIPQNELQKGWFSSVIPPVVEWAWENEGVINVAEKAENFPSVRPYGRIGDWPIFGIVGLQPEVEPLMPLIDERVVYGEPLREEGTCLLHRYMRQNAKIGVGDQIVIRGVPMRVVGFFEGLLPIADVDGETMLPKYQVIVSTDPIMIEVRVCNEYEVVITTLETALSIEDVHVSRIDVELEPGSDLETIGKSMALSREYRIWISEGGRAHLAYMGSQIGGKGLPIVVPWAIVILNVVTTMLNSMYERHREIDILSSIGLNPRDIAGVFLAEVSILGVTGGGIGYLMGLGLYPLMTSIGLAPVVSQKVSAVWLVAALGISMASVIFGSMMALRGSVGLTPSLTRRWTSGDQMVSRRGAWETRLPVRIDEEDLEEFTSYLKDYLVRFTGLDSIPRVGNVKQTVEDGRRTLHFSYNQMDSSIKATRTSNVITLARDEEGFYLPTLESAGERDAASKTGTFVRGIVIRWSTEHRDEG